MSRKAERIANRPQSKDRLIVVKNAWDDILEEHVCVPLYADLFLRVNPTGTFEVTSRQHVRIASGILNRYADGYGDNVDGDPQRVANRLISSNFREYHIKILKYGRTIIISGRNSDYKVDINNWMGKILIYS